MVKPDNGGYIYTLATPCCHNTLFNFASDDAEMDALIYRLNVLETGSQCKNDNHSTPISSSHQTNLR